MPLNYTDADWALIRRTCGEFDTKGTADDFGRFRTQCERTGLDPMSRQIYAVFRWSEDSVVAGNTKRGGHVMSIQASIDGFRLIAERTGKYAGQRGPFWCGDDGVWMADGMGMPIPWRKEGYPYAAVIGVLRTDFQEPLFAVARWSGYHQTVKGGHVAKLWAKMPDLMLAKCAESLALRRAFPQELSGIYTDAEMAQATNDDTPTDTASPKQNGQSPVTTPQPKKWADMTQADRFGAMQAKIHANKSNVRTLTQIHDWLSTRKADLAERDYATLVESIIDLGNSAMASETDATGRSEK